RFPPRSEQRCDDFQLPLRIAAMGGSPEGGAEHGAVGRLNVGPGTSLEQQSDDVDVVAENRVEEGGLSVVMMAVDVHTAIEQKLDVVVVPIPGGYPPRHFAPGNGSRIHELPYNVEPPDPRRADQARVRAPCHEIRGGFGTAVRETRVDRVGAMTGQ